MVSEQDRLAQIFIWRQGSAPDIEYVRQLLSAVNPDAVRAISADDPPLKLFTIVGSWPQDMWARALLDMQASPAPDGTQWVDTTHYDLAGWQGADSRTGEQLWFNHATFFHVTRLAPTVTAAATFCPPLNLPIGSRAVRRSLLRSH